MTGTVPAAQVRALAAAIRTALDPPRAALSVERARLIEQRAAYICGALLPLATGQDTQIWADAAAETIREAVTDLPARYATREDTSAPLDRGRYDAASPAEVAQGVAAIDKPLPHEQFCGCSRCKGLPAPRLRSPADEPASHSCDDSCALYPGWDDPPAGMAEFAEPVTHKPFPHFPHLPQHQHGSPVCIICGIDHNAEVHFPPPAWIRYARQSPGSGYLAPPAGYQLHSASIPPQEKP